MPFGYTGSLPKRPSRAPVTKHAVALPAIRYYIQRTSGIQTHRAGAVRPDRSALIFGFTPYSGSLIE